MNKLALRAIIRHPWFPHVRALLFLLALPIAGSGYVLLNVDNGGARLLTTELDNAIPFIKIFAVPYLFWIVFLYICLIYFCFKDRMIYYKLIASYVISVLLCYAIYYVFQTTVPRPDLIGNDIFTWMVRRIYGNDLPYNCFPSIHCMSSFLMFSGLLRSRVRNARNTFWIGSVASLIILSTLFIKQHVVWDAIAGIVLAELVFTALHYGLSPAERTAVRKKAAVSRALN